jgi:hypothetical protein
MRKTYGFVAIALVLLGIAVYPRAGSTPIARQEAGLRDELVRLTAELADESAARQRAIAKLEAQLRSLAVISPRGLEAQPTAAVPAAVLHGPPSQLERHEPPEPVHPAEHLESAFASQTIDAAWAHDAEDRVQQKLHASVSGARLQSVECHASMCRIETVHTDAAAFGQFATDAFKDPDKRIWGSDAFTDEPIEGAHGELIVVSYLAREGETLPQIR